MTRLLPLAWCLLALPAAAETHRVAIVVGNNQGDGANATLHYAESDAAKLAQVLVDLGGVSPGDLLLLQGRSLSQLQDALAVAANKVAAWHTSPEARVVLLFYFSGHSDGEALELGPDRLPYSDLRHWLAATHAEVRVAIVDSCHSGALLTAKGATPSPAFDIQVHDELSSTGQVLLTSSAANELALESSEIRGSFFTHHFVSGLRGAADLSGDGRVTLAEAYEYAFAHTVSATAGTQVGPQHPAYDYALSGQGDLVLSDLSQGGASLVLPKGFERALVTDLVRDRVVAEVVRGGGNRVMVPPGEYAVRLWREGKGVAGRLVVAEGERREVRWDELGTTAPEAPTASKGPSSSEVTTSALAPPDRFPAGLALMVGVGVGHGVAEDLGPVPSLQVGLRQPGRTFGWAVSLDLSTGSGAGFRETSGMLRAGYLGSVTLHGLQLSLGPEVGVGVIAQSLDDGSIGATPAGALGVMGGLSYPLTSTMALSLEGDCPAALVQLSGKLGVVWLPAGWLGLRVAL